MRLVIILMLALPAVVVAAFDTANGRRLFEQHCTGCHAPDGAPTLPGAPDLRDADVLFKTDAEIIEVLRFGRRTMPGFEGLIDRRELLDVLDYLRSLDR